jgi:L-lactate dehydrogenase complex protein LldG
MSLTARDSILLKIRQALTQQVPIPFAGRGTNEFVFQNSLQDLELEFAENFSKLQGRFSFCTNTTELTTQLNLLVESRKWSKVICKETALATSLINHQFVNINNEISLSNCEAAITSCESLIARTGSLLLSSATESGRNDSVYAPVHICIAYTSQLVYDIADGLALIKTKYGANLPSSISLATGPSRTADIEKTLVVGVHGPKEVFCFLVDG